MPTLLHLDASPRGDFSISRQLSAAAVDTLEDKQPGGRVVERDLTKTEMAFVDLDWIIGGSSTPARQTESHKRALSISDMLITELLEADEIVIGTPMYNLPCRQSLRRGSTKSCEREKLSTTLPRDRRDLRRAVRSLSW